jgi:asparagine synthase (glutamine-hydrolysing)
MCGIAGIIEFNEGAVNEDHLLQMNAFNLNRGPDGAGIWIENSVGLAHCRLSIIDLSENGHQPMADVNKKTVITFNGEIYNFNNLRAQLLSKGYSFFSNTDTEVILNGYLEWGMPKLLQFLDGMFAFVLFDRDKNKAFMCRDRFGKKPLYYFMNAQRIYFASDIRSISSIQKDLTLNYQSLDYYLAELSSPQPNTIWNEIKQVKNANYLNIDITAKKVTENSYWRLESKPDYSMTMADAIETVEEKLKLAILKRTIGDEKVAAFLSGGIDSGLIVALLSLNSSGQVNTFTAGLEYEAMDEQNYASQLAKRYNTNHQTYIVKSDIIELLPDLINAYGEPFADSSNIPSYYITREMHKLGKVALSGDGGDEIMGGYHDYAWAFLTDQYLKKHPNKNYRKLVTLYSKTTNRFFKSQTNLGHFESYAQINGGQKLFRNMGFNEEEKIKLYAPEMLKKVSGASALYLNAIWEENKQDSILNTLFASSVHSRLLNDYLVKVDRASMMNSLEIRCPFLDKDLAEFSFTIPGI